MFLTAVGLLGTIAAAGMTTATVDGIGTSDGRNGHGRNGRVKIGVVVMTSQWMV